MAVVSGKKKAVFPAAVEWLLHPQTEQAVEMDLLPKQQQYRGRSWGCIVLRRCETSVVGFRQIIFKIVHEDTPFYKNRLFVLYHIFL